MGEDGRAGTYALLVELADIEMQNVQALASTCSGITNACQEIETEIGSAYAVLGPYDFLAIFRAPSPQAALQTSLLVIRHGFEVQTMGLVSTDQFAHLVDDV